MTSPTTPSTGPNALPDLPTPDATDADAVKGGLLARALCNNEVIAARDAGSGLATGIRAPSVALGDVTSD
jgi:hypothetical protein